MASDSHASPSDHSRLNDAEHLLLYNLEEYGFPPSEFEASTLVEVLTLPRITVERPPEHQLLAIGMIPNDCHVNCWRQATNDTEGRSRHVTGWLISGASLILHSVAEIDGQWFCLTPQIVKGPNRFQFIPDQEIEWRDAADGMGREPYRKGQLLRGTLRKYPEFHVRMCEEVKSLMANGMRPTEARDQVYAKLGQEFEALEPI